MTFLRTAIPASNSSLCASSLGRVICNAYLRSGFAPCEEVERRIIKDLGALSYTHISMVAGYKTSFAVKLIIVLFIQIF